MSNYGPKPIPPAERFWPRVNKNGPVPAHRPGLGQCWVWTGGASYSEAGYYGKFYLPEKKNTRAHVWAYTTIVQPIPEGLVLDHLCRNTLCVNPAHLEPVTQRENCLRGYGASGCNARLTHCKRGHEFTPENTYTTKDGSRKCRQCNAEDKRRYSGKTYSIPYQRRNPSSEE